MVISRECRLTDNILDRLLDPVPQALRYRVAYRIVQMLMGGWNFMRRHDSTLRTIFFRWFEALVTYMTQQEIAMARQGRANEGSTLKPYAHCKLDSPRDIRLLKLHRKVVGSPPTGELVHRSLDETPESEAVSYT